MRSRLTGRGLRGGGVTDIDSNAHLSEVGKECGSVLPITGQGATQDPIWNRYLIEVRALGIDLCDLEHFHPDEQCLLK